MIKHLSSLLRRKSKKSFSYKEEVLVREGAVQFKKLVEKGIELPVVLL